MEKSRLVTLLLAGGLALVAAVSVVKDYFYNPHNEKIYNMNLVEVRTKESKYQGR